MTIRPRAPDTGRLAAGAIVLALGALGDAALAADAGRGQRLYEGRCGACHSIDDHRVGPKHAGLIGRRAGGANGYEYSAALAAATFAWDAGQLDRWLADPQRLVPGQKMGYSVPDADDRRDLIAYLLQAGGARQ